MEPESNYVSPCTGNTLFTNAESFFPSLYMCPPYLIIPETGRYVNTLLLEGHSIPVLYNIELERSAIFMNTAVSRFDFCKSY